MKKILSFILIMILSALATGNYVKTTFTFQCREPVLDSAGIGKLVAESVHVMTYFAGFECIDAWYDTSDAQCKLINGHLMFFDTYGDIDADSGTGEYLVQWEFIDSGGTLYGDGEYRFCIGEIEANATSISGDKDASDRLETMLDGTGGNQLTLSKLKIAGGGSGDTAVSVFPNATSGIGMVIGSGATGDAVVFSSTSGNDFNTTLNLDDLTGTLDSNEVNATSFIKGWNIPFNTSFTAGSMGDSLNNSSYVQGAAGLSWADYINYADYTHDIAHDSAQVGWLIFNSGDTSSYFYTSTDSVNTKGGIVDTVRSAENVEADSYTPDVNVAQISGDGTAADNLEAVLDGTGGVQLTLKKLSIKGGDAGDTAVSITPNATSGTGLYVGSGSTGDAAIFNSASGNDINATLTEVDTVLNDHDNLANLDEAISGIDDNPWNNADSDTGSGMGAWMQSYFSDIEEDSSGAVSIDYEQFWYNIDSTNADTSIIGEWLVNNLGGVASVPESLLAVVTVINSYLDIAVSAARDSIMNALPCYAGASEYLVILKVFDESDNGLSNTNLTVTNGGDATFYPETNANGIDSIYLAAGSWYVYAYNGTYLQNTIPQTVTVSAAMTDTIEMTSQSTGSGFVRFWAMAFDYQNGSAIEDATLTVRPTKYGWINTSTGGTYLPRIITADTDSTGLVSIIVPRTSSVTASGSDSLKYNITFGKTEWFDLKATNVIGRDSVSQKIVWDITDAGE